MKICVDCFCLYKADNTHLIFGASYIYLVYEDLIHLVDFSQTTLPSGLLTFYSVSLTLMQRHGMLCKRHEHAG